MPCEALLEKGRAQGHWHCLQAVLPLSCSRRRTVNHALRSSLVRTAHDIGLDVLERKCGLVNVALHIHDAADIGQDLQQRCGARLAVNDWR